MAYGYAKKTEETLLWMENREKINLQARQILRRVLDIALSELDKEFEEALNRGELLQVIDSGKELKALLLSAAQKELSLDDN